MKNISKVFLLFSMAIILSVSLAGQARAGQTCIGPCLGGSIDIADLQDQRSFGTDNYNPSTSDGGLTNGTNGWPGFVIAWDISETSPSSGLWDYVYTISWSQKDLSHFILELTDQNTILTNLSINDSGATMSTPQLWDKGGNIDFPGTIFGTKFDNFSGTGPKTISFQTTSDPVWGNFFTKDGKLGGAAVFAYNDGLDTGTYPDSSDKLQFIARPNGGSNPPVVPEPISSTLFIVGAATLGFRRFRKK